MLYLCNVLITLVFMLGIFSSREPVKGQFAKDVKDALIRSKKGELTMIEKEHIKKVEELKKKFHIVWK